MNSRNAWNDFYNTQQPTLINKQTYESRLSSSSESVYVSNCLFRSINSASNGGALYCSSTKYLLVESSSFFSCKTSSNGGAIYFYNSNDGQSALHRVCGNNCCTTSSTNGQFTYISVKDSISNKNYVNYSSFTRCVNGYSGSWFTVYHYYGKICYTSDNSSMNKCGYRTGFYCYTSTNSAGTLLTYSSCTDNHALSAGCVRYEGSGAKNEIKCCNILRNTQDTTSEGTFVTSQNLMIEDSCILENEATNIFYISSSTDKIIISNCTVDKTTYNQNLVIQKTVTRSFILALNHMSTQSCHAEYDTVGSLTVIPQCSCSIIIEQVVLHTCNHHRARISDFFTLSSVFIIAFIHQNPSGDC
jgi:hypothetical protein